MFLTPEQTGGACIFSLREGNRYLAINPAAGGIIMTVFDIRQLAEALGQGAGDTWQEHASLILLACCDGRPLEYLVRSTQ